jgi:NAD(P)-dependent dehydrogenase (short-subunit alcohol dehydrogenase family)
MPIWRREPMEVAGMNKLDLQGRVAVVTGGAQGIGRAVAERLKAGGAEVALWDMDLSLAKETAQALAATAVRCDIADWASVEAARDATMAALGRIDVLVNSAGIAGPTMRAEDYPIEEFRKVVDIDLVGTFLVNRAVIPGMRERNYGRIVNIASIAGKEGNPNAAAYAAAKAGVIGMTKSLGKENADRNISINCVTPAAARTRIFDQLSEEFIAMMLSKIPRGRFLEVDEAAALIAWMCTEENSFNTGAVFDLSGGRATY